MLAPGCEVVDPSTRDLLRTAPALPPVTRETLSELDLNWIMHNISLRVDVNYDHDLHFMPIKGPCGDQKRKDAQRYWRALATELCIYQHVLVGCQECQEMPAASRQAFVQRLPAMFRTLKDLLETLVPDRDHSNIEERLDIEFLMQQVRNGVLDIVGLSRWVAELLKSHCAPMRDEWADDMATEIATGVTKSNTDQVVQGLEKLFSFLEAMKLDVANHQIRTFRYPLIENTVAFQEKHFRQKIQENKITTQESQEWYDEARKEHQACQSLLEPNDQRQPFKALVHGIVQRCTRRHREPLPATLAYDKGRLKKLRDDVQDSIYLRICLKVFNDLLSKRFGAGRVAAGIYQTLEGRLVTLVGKRPAQSRRETWEAEIQDVGMEITRAAFKMCRQGHRQIPDEAFEWTIAYLRGAFAEGYGPIAKEIHERLEQTTFLYTAIFQEKTPLQMSEAQKLWEQTRTETRLWRADAEDIARRVAHMSILHWRVWASLVYLRGEEDEQMVENVEESTYPMDMVQTLPGTNGTAVEVEIPE